MHTLTCLYCQGSFPSATRMRRPFCSETCRDIANNKRFAEGIARRNMTRVGSGAFAELTVCADLLRRGYFVYRSVSPTSGCDIVVDCGGRLLRVEVKTAKPSKDGRLVPAVPPPTAQCAKHDILAMASYDGRVEYWPDLEGGCRALESSETH